MGITLIIGDCGSGKSVHGAWMCSKYMKKGYNVYSNLYLDGSYKLEVSDLMKYEFGENAVLFFDEAVSHGFGSRGNMYKKTITDDVVQFFTMYRHYKVKEIIVVSPSFSDVIPIIRDNATNVIVTKKSIFNFIGLNKYKRIFKYVDIKEGEPRMSYDYIPFSTRLYNRSPIFKLYDSYTRKDLLEKDFEKWSNKNELELIEDEEIKLIEEFTKE